MPRIQGVDIPPNKRVHVALTYLYGIGNKIAMEICAAAGIAPEIKSRDLSEDEAFVDELRSSLRFIVSVLFRRIQKVFNKFYL